MAGNLPTHVVVWLPPAREHLLAFSLGLVVHDRQTCLDWVAAVKAEFEPKGVEVRVVRSRCERVVQALRHLGLTNTSENRSVAYAFLWNETKEDREDSRSREHRTGE